MDFTVTATRAVLLNMLTLVCLEHGLCESRWGDAADIGAVGAGRELVHFAAFHGGDVVFLWHYESVADPEAGFLCVGVAVVAGIEGVVGFSPVG